VAELHPGEQAPAFRAKDQHGNDFDPASLRGSRWVLYFFPKADTAG
jgi:peroxiredoxin Q/BCP